MLRTHHFGVAHGTGFNSKVFSKGGRSWSVPVFVALRREDSDFMFTNSDFWDGPSSPLGDNFVQRAKGANALATFDRSFLDALDARAKTDRDASSWAATISDALKTTSRGDLDGERGIAGLIETARDALYPASARLLRELQAASEVGGDDTLRRIDRGVLRRLDDEAPTDAESRTFRNDLLARLSEEPSKRSSSWASGVYEVYGEALVLQVLRSRMGTGMTITKVPESSRSSPDFKCVWERPAAAPLTFFIEVKSLDVVGGGAKLNEDREKAFEGALELERQQNAGKRVSSAMRVIAPFRKAGPDPDYASRSLRLMVERTGAKIGAAFGGKQFAEGPTFAFVNLLRLAHMHHGPQALSRVFSGDLGKVNGVWWTLAFGRAGSAMCREPEFEGAAGDDGVLGRAGIFVDPAITLPTAGLMLLFEEKKSKRIVGLKAPQQPDFPAWDDGAARAVLDVLCDAWNDRADSRTQKSSWD